MRFRFVNRSIQPVANSIARVTEIAIAIVRQAPRPQATPRAAATQTVAAVVRPSTLRVSTLRRITPAPMKADPSHNALDHTLHDAAQRIGILGHPLDLDAGDRDRGGSEGDKAERAHADRLVREIAVETNGAARGGGGEQAYEHIAEVKVQGSHPSALVDVVQIYGAFRASSCVRNVSSMNL